jgi:hypothetical protein
MLQINRQGRIGICHRYLVAGVTDVADDVADVADVAADIADVLFRPGTCF